MFKPSVLGGAGADEIAADKAAAHAEAVAAAQDAGHERSKKAETGDSLGQRGIHGSR